MGTTAVTEPRTVTVLLRVPTPHRSYVHWILEAHEGLVTLTEPADADGELVLLAAAEHLPDLDLVLDALAAEVPLTRRIPPVS